MVWVKTYKKNVKLGVPKYVKIIRHKIVGSSNCEPTGYRTQKLRKVKRCKPVKRKPVKRCKPVKKRNFVTNVVTSSLMGFRALNYPDSVTGKKKRCK